MPAAVLCPQQAAQVSTVNPPIDVLLIAIEDSPPAPRPPDPPPPPPPTRTFRGLPAVKAWGAWDAYWWLTLLRANTVPDGQYVTRTLAARGPYGAYSRWSDPADVDVVFGWYASMYDRAYMGFNGTNNDQQLLSYIFTHGFGQQEVQGQLAWNRTFAQQGYQQAQRVSPLLAGEPAGRPIAVLGHSYGGAVADVVYQILRQTGPVSFDRKITAGTPRDFTSVVTPPYAGTQSMRFRNAGDPVPDMPPPALLGRVLLGPFSPTDYGQGDYFAPGPELTILGASGVVQRPPLSPTPPEWIGTFASFLSNGLDLEPHFARAYVGWARAWVDADNDGSGEGWADPTALFQINTDLANIGV